MKHSLVYLVLLVATAASADENKTSPAAGDYFTRAEQADAKGDLDRAIDLYERSYRAAPHANTAYNLADALERKKRYSEALIYYELYLTLSPKATDRAKVKKLITALESRPTTFEITGDGHDGSVDLRTAYVIIDGAIVKKPGGSRVDIKLAPGFHTIDIVTPTGVASDEVDVRRTGGSKPYQVKEPSAAEGNAVVSTSVVEAAFANDRVDRTAKRIAMPVGKQLVAVYDGRRECAPITADIKRGKTVTYVHVALATADQSPRGSMKFPTHCRKLRVTQHALTFK
jgi:hypothetical protein